MVVAAAGLAAVVAAFVAFGGDDGDDGASVATGVSATTTTTAPFAPESTTVDSTIAPSTTASTARPTTTTRATVSPTAPPATTPTRCPRPARGSDFDGFGAEEIIIENGEGSHRSCILTADTPEQRRQGLMHQDDLDTYDGMIFRFEEEQELQFWMRNTRIPLSIAFYNAAGGFVSATDMEPCGDSPDCPRYSSGGPAKFALEVQKGALPSVGGTPGSRLHA